MTTGLGMVRCGILVTINHRDIFFSVLCNLKLWNGLLGVCQELHPFVETVVNFTIEGIARLNILGVRHVLIGNLPPIGCFPSATLADNYTRCMNISQELLETHNSMLENAIQGLSTRTESRVVLLDQFAGFTDAMKGRSRHYIRICLSRG